MQAVLFICHGSRRKTSCDEVHSFMEDCQKEFSHIPIVEYCFLELAAPSIEEGFRRCVERGAANITAIPFLLLTAGHVMYDIPHELHQMQVIYPEIKITYGRPIGVTDKMTRLLVDKVQETKLPAQDMHVVVVGRGSRITEVREQLDTIVAPLKSVYPFVSVSYLTACEPSFTEGLAQALRTECSSIVVVPYMLFSGVLTESIAKTVDQYNEQHKSVVITSPLATHPNVKAALLDRVAEAMG